MKPALLFLVICGVLWPGNGPRAGEVVFGYLEDAVVYPGALPMQAKLDTGADNTAIHAVNISVETRDGQDWVAFDLVNKAGERLRLEKPLIRIAKIKRRSGPRQERPVVRLQICLGNSKREADVSLVDRAHFNYRLLIGRSFLAGHGLIDSAKKFTTKPDCP